MTPSWLGWLVGLLGALPPAAGTAGLVDQASLLDSANLVGASGLAMSPDGASLYAAASGVETVLSFGRDQATGALSLLGTHRDPVSLAGAWGVAVSPDGANVYVTGSTANSLVSFSRNPVTGTLSEQHNTVDAGMLGGAMGVAVSPDGLHVYVACSTGKSVAWFTRDGSTGLLSQLDSFSHATLMVGTADVAISADGAQVYAVAAVSYALIKLDRDQSSGALSGLVTLRDSLALRGVSSLALSPDGLNIYVVASDMAVSADGVILSYSRDSDTGLLRERGGGRVAALAGASDVAVTADGAYVYAVARSDSAAYSELAIEELETLTTFVGAVVMFVREQTEGVLREVLVLQDAAELKGPTGLAVSPEAPYHVYATMSNASSIVRWTRAELTAHTAMSDGAAGVIAGIAMSPDGTSVYVVDAWGDSISTLSRNSTTGALVLEDTHKDSINLDGAWGVAVSPDGANVYATGSAANSAVSFSRDPATGALNNQLNTGWSGTLAGAEGIVVSPADPSSYVYVASSEANGIVPLRRNASTGLVNELSIVDSANLAGAWGVAVSPDGANVYVTGSTANSLVSFSRDPVTGALSEQHNTVDAGMLGGAMGVAVSPDGLHVYVACSTVKSVAWFTRDGSTGLLSNALFVVDGQDLDGAASVAISADGGNVYAVAQTSSSIVTYSRQAFSGSLIKAGSVSDAVNLRGAAAVVVSPDGGNVYVAATSATIVIFTREPSTGGLLDQVNIQDSINLDGAAGLAMSTDGKSLYVAASGAKTLLTYGRDPATGALTLRGTRRDVFNLAGTRGVAVSPDGTNVYATGSTSDSVVSFSRDLDTGILSEQHNTVDTNALEGALGVVVSPGGSHLYVVCRDANAVIPFQLDSSTGVISTDLIVRDSVNLDGVRGLALSPDGLHLYAVAFSSNAIVAYSRNAVTGWLSGQSVVRDDTNLAGAWGVAVSPDGANVYVTGSTANSLVSFSRDPVTGALSEQHNTVDAGMLGGAMGVAVSPDGLHVYVVTLSSFVVFTRIAPNRRSIAGSLGQRVISVDIDGGKSSSDSDWSGGARGVVVSPDGSHVYSVTMNWIAQMSTPRLEITTSTTMPPTSAPTGSPTTKAPTDVPTTAEPTPLGWVSSAPTPSPITASPTTGSPTNTNGTTTNDTTGQAKSDNKELPGEPDSSSSGPSVVWAVVAGLGGVALLVGGWLLWFFLCRRKTEDVGIFISYCRAESATEAQMVASLLSDVMSKAALLAHFKHEAGNGSRLFSKWQDDRLTKHVFLDSEQSPLHNDKTLLRCVQQSEVLVLLLTANVLTRPWRFGFDWAGVEGYLSDLHTNMDGVNPGAGEMLAAHGVDDIDKFSVRLRDMICSPEVCALQFDALASKQRKDQVLDELISTLVAATSNDGSNLRPSSWSGGFFKDLEDVCADPEYTVTAPDWLVTSEVNPLKSSATPGLKADIEDTDVRSQSRSRTRRRGGPSRDKVMPFEDDDAPAGRKRAMLAVQQHREKILDQSYRKYRIDCWVGADSDDLRRLCTDLITRFRLQVSVSELELRLADPEAQGTMDLEHFKSWFYAKFLDRVEGDTPSKLGGATVPNKPRSGRQLEPKPGSLVHRAKQDRLPQPEYNGTEQLIELTEIGVPANPKSGDKVSAPVPKRKPADRKPTPSDPKLRAELDGMLQEFDVKDKNRRRTGKVSGVQQLSTGGVPADQPNDLANQPSDLGTQPKQDQADELSLTLSLGLNDMSSDDDLSLGFDDVDQDSEDSPLSGSRVKKEDLDDEIDLDI